MLRLDGYIRVSRVGGREGEGYISPVVQREAIESYAAELDGEIVSWWDDQDFGGGTTDRPGFQAMLARLEAAETDGIVVMRVDRFARSTADGLAVVRSIIDRGQVFASCYERMDPRTPEGAFMLRSFFSNAELFLDQIRVSWKVAKARAIAAGKHIGPTPVGYLKVEAVPTKPTHISPVDSAARGGSTVPGVLVPHPVYGPAVAHLFERAGRGGRGDTELARWMTERAPREGGGVWNPSEIRRWLRNRVYLGEVRYGELVKEDAHERLVSPKTWARCQRPEAERFRASSPFLLSGLIRCAGCRYAMGGQSGGGTGGETPVYRCPRSSRGCPSPSVITAERVESYVIEAATVHRAGLLEQTEAGDDESAIEAFDAAEAEVQAFAADVDARRMLGEVGWQSGLRARVDARDALRPARDAALARREAQKLAQVPLADLSRHDLRDLLSGMVRHIFVRRQRAASAADRTLIVWGLDQAPIAVPGPHVGGPFDPIVWD